ncbi:MAG: sugar transferase [Bradyrhizobium sp.]|uniref:sugar transferase n=1 Tax=Bradyrhizobium sp. TaxID=376 RepID=UPI0023A40C25|nr:sugar transferase [Bradyrhizobium sp.]MDE2602191.1 sugar transferase [Bradyrhizobium sp.]
MRLPSPTSRRNNKIYLSIWDLLWALLTPPIALWVVDALVITQQVWSMVAFYCALSSGFALMAFVLFRLQDTMTRHFSAHEALDVFEAVLFAQLMTCGVLFTFNRLDGIPRSLPLYQGLLLAGGLIFARILTRAGAEERPSDYKSRSERIIIVGANRLASSLILMLNAYAPSRQAVVAVLDDKAGAVGRAVAGVQVLGTSQDLEAIVGEFAVHGVSIGRVIVAGDGDLLSSAVLHDLERVCKKRQLALSYLPHMLGLSGATVSQENVLAAAEAAPRLRLYLRMKRCFDVVASLALMIMLLPLFAIATVLALIDVGSPVLFWQERTGWRGRPFLIYKYRTLRAPFESDGRLALGDRQPSAIGRFLRATRIDELPQLINVLFGDMSLIGPRPLLPEDQPSSTVLRLSVRPGITGWAQVNGAKLVTKDDKEKFDEWYVANASFWVDIKIVLMTLRTLSRNFLGSTEAAADLAQVEKKRANLAAVGTAQAEQPPALADQSPMLQPAALAPVRPEVMKRSA